MVDKYLLFNVGENLHAIKIDEVSQIYFGEKVTPIPLSEPEVRGIVSIQENLKTVIDLNLCLYNKETNMDSPDSKRFIGLANSEQCFLSDTAVEIVSIEDTELKSLSIDDSNFLVAKYKDNVFSIIKSESIINKVFGLN